MTEIKDTVIPLAEIRSGICYAWHGPSVLITDNQGCSGAAEQLTGYYFRETRYLHGLQLQINGVMPFPASVAEANPNTLEFSAIYPPVESAGGGGTGSGGSGSRDGLLFRTLDFRLVYEVHVASVEVGLRITNRWNETADFELSWVLSADYAGLSEAHAGKRQQEAPVEAVASPEGVRFRYMHPELPFQTHVSVEGTGSWAYSEGRLSSHLSLERQESATIKLVIRAVDFENHLSSEAELIRTEHEQQWQQRVTRLFAPGETLLTELTNRAMRDLGSLSLLDGDENEWLTPSAGMPMYPATFGRDALTTGWQSAMLDRGDQIRATLARLRRVQGTVHDDWRDEQPGRIAQQMRKEPLARLGINPFARYYGDFAAPLMFIIACGHLYAWSGKKRDLEENWDALRRVIDWARDYGDADNDGYLEYRTRSEQGPKHQGWKDSDNAMVDENGHQVEPPIAPCEIQGYYYAALQFMAVFSLLMGNKRDALDLWRQAKQLKQRFNQDFWDVENGYIVLGLDADKRPIRSLTSNAGQCMTTGILDKEHLPRMVRRLFQPDLYSGWGIRTLSSDNPAYNPLEYHLGSVWAVENGTILLGLRRFGFDDRAVELARGLYDLARCWPGGRIPECVGGYSRQELNHPGSYPQSNTPQAWNQSVYSLLLQTLLGIRPMAALDLLLVSPLLPPWLPEITLKGLRIGGARVSLRFWRDENGDSNYEVLEQEGTLRIVNQPPLNSLSEGIWDRFVALSKGALPT